MRNKAEVAVNDGDQTGLPLSTLLLSLLMCPQAVSCHVFHRISLGKNAISGPAKVHSGLLRPSLVASGCHTREGGQSRQNRAWVSLHFPHPYILKLQVIYSFGSSVHIVWGDPAASHTCRNQADISLTTKEHHISSDPSLGIIWGSHPKTILCANSAPDAPEHFSHVSIHRNHSQSHPRNVKHNAGNGRGGKVHSNICQKQLLSWESKHIEEVRKEWD